MIILIAPDKFKGSLSAQEVCEILSGEIIAKGSHEVVALPLADGGEGTCELLTSISGGTMIKIPVRDPLARTIESGYGVSNDGRTAFLEMATASGLQLLKKEERNPLLTTTLGTGDLIRHALDQGVDHVIMGIGGSATTDCGMGMAESLGVVFYDRSGNKLPGIGANLPNVFRIDSTGIHPRIGSVKFTIFCDVDNPLHGFNGAAYIFSPQKGADEAMVKELDFGLKHFQQVLEATTGRKVDFAGAGAGGGLPSALKAFASIDIRPGMDFIAEFIGLEQKIMNADLVVTGEGKVDKQTLAGKVVKGVADLSRKHRKPLVVVAGRNELDPQDLAKLGVTRLVTLIGDGVDEQDAIRRAADVLKKRTQEQIIPLFL